MTKRSEVFARIGLVLTIGFGSLHAQSAVQEGREAAVPRAQGETPLAQPVLTEPRPLAGMNLDFTAGAKLGTVFQDLGRHSGVSIILHASVAAREITTTADLRGMTFQRALDALLEQNDLFYKVLDPTSIMVYKKTPQNLQEFEPRQIKTFYLANADLDAVRQNLNALMPQLRVFIDKRLNAVTVSCTQAELAKAQQIVRNLDKSRGELSLQMEIIEVARKGSPAAGLLRAAGTAPNPDAKDIPTGLFLAMVMEDAGSKLLASPELRVVAGESSEIRIGRKLTQAQVAAAAKGAGKTDDNRSAVPSDDLGLKLKVRPRLHPDHAITLDLECEFTDPLKPVEPGRPSLSVRALKTSLRLKDGETVVLCGLLEDEGRDGAPASAGPAKETKDRLLVVKAVVLNWGEQ